jgi:hypothetical protein
MTPDDRWPPDPGEASQQDLPDAEWDAAEARLVERLATLPRSIEPPRDLWPGIAARLDEAAARRPHRAALLAVGLAAALLVAFVAGRWSGVAGPEPAPPASDPPTAVAAVSVDVPPNLAAASASLERTRLELELAFHARRADLPPATLAVVDKNLATIGQAIAEIELALESHPSDPQLGRRLVAYKTREIALLEQAQRAAARL